MVFSLLVHCVPDETVSADSCCLAHVNKQSSVKCKSSNKIKNWDKASDVTLKLKTVVPNLHLLVCKRAI